MRGLGAAACAAFALACRGPQSQDPARDAGTDGLPEGGSGCADTVIRSSSFVSGKDWAAGLGVVRGWFVTSASGLAVVAVGYARNGSPTIETAEMVVGVFSVDSEDASVLDVRELALFPSGITPTDASVDAVAAHGDLLAIGLDDSFDGDAQRVALVPTTTTELPTFVSLPIAEAPSPVIGQSFAAWDGEAFAMHAYGVPPTTLFVSRVATDGTVLMPLTRYGRTASDPTTILGHVSSTSPESGRTYVFDASGAGYLSGHLRDGTPLPGTETQAKKIQAVGTPTLSPHLPGVAADAEGAWVGFEQYNGTNIGMPMLVQRLTADGDPSGPAIEVPLFPLDDPGGVRTWDLVSAGPNRVTVTAASSFGVYAMDVEDGEVRNLRAVAKFDGKKEDIRDLIALEHAGELWIGFSENSNGTVLRVLKASPGCVYGATR